MRVTTSVSPTMTRDVAVTQAAETTIPSTRFADEVVFLPPLLFIKLSGSSRHPAGAAAQLSHPSHCLVTPPNCVINCLSQAFRVQVLCPFHLPFVGPHRTSYLTQQLHPRTFGCKCRVLETLNKMKGLFYIFHGEVGSVVPPSPASYAVTSRWCGWFASCQGHHLHPPLSLSSTAPQHDHQLTNFLVTVRPP